MWYFKHLIKEQVLSVPYSNSENNSGNITIVTKWESKFFHSLLSFYMGFAPSLIKLLNANDYSADPKRMCKWKKKKKKSLWRTEYLQSTDR